MFDLLVSNNQNIAAFYLSADEMSQVAMGALIIIIVIIIIIIIMYL